MTDYRITPTERLVNAVVYRLVRTLIHKETDELARIPEKGPLLLVTNHINFIEGPLVYTDLQHRQERCLTGFAKIELWDNPIIGFLFDTWDTVPINRAEADLGAIKNAVSRIKAGAIFAISPEGTRSHDARLLRAHPGIAMLGLMSGAPILPFGGYGHENYRQDFKRLRRPTYHLTMGKPFRLDPRGQRVKGQVRQVMADEIMYQLAALLPEKYRGEYADLTQATTRYLNFDDVD